MNEDLKVALQSRMKGAGLSVFIKVVRREQETTCIIVFAVKIQEQIALSIRASILC